MPILNLLAELAPLIVLAALIAFAVGHKAGWKWGAGIFVAALIGLIVVQTFALGEAQRIAGSTSRAV